MGNLILKQQENQSLGTVINIVCNLVCIIFERIRSSSDPVQSRKEQPHITDVLVTGIKERNRKSVCSMYVGLLEY